MNIDKVSASREMDALIAEKVMGLETELIITALHGEELLYFGEDRFLCHVPHYSVNISAAWEVVEKWNEKSFHIMRFSHRSEGGSEMAVALESRWYRASFDASARVFSEAESAPLAICRAALKAVEGKEEG